MPNAAGVRSLGDLFGLLTAPPAHDKTLCPQCGLPATHAHLPCGRCLQKPPPWQRLVTVADYAPPLSPLIHQLKFSRRQRNRQRPVASVTIGSLTRSSHHAGCNCRIASSAFRYGSGVTGVGDLIRAICCVSRYHAGCTADGIAKPLHEHGPLRPSIFSVPGCASAT